MTDSRPPPLAHGSIPNVTSSPLILMLGLIAPGQAPVDPGPVNAELSAYLREIAAKLDDPARSPEERLRLAEGAAATLDRAAQAAADPTSRRALWDRAAAFLDSYANRAEAENRPPLAVRAATLRWAVARSWLDQFELAPTETIARDEAERRLDQVIGALKPLSHDNNGSDEARYRLARALADRARLDAGNDDIAHSRRDEALHALEPIPGDSPWQAHAGPLRAELLRADGRPESSLQILEAAGGGPDLAPLRARALADLGRFDEAIEALNATGIPPAEARQARLDVRLAQAARAADPADRAKAQAAACAEAAALQGAPGRLARIRLARAIEQPEPELPSSALETLAEGAQALGRSQAAAAWLASAAESAEDPARAASLRYRSATTLLEAGRPEDARSPLAAVRDDPRAGPLRPKAAMLLALIAGRDGADPSAALAALQTVIRDFPDDPLAGEARFRLGVLLAQRDQLDAAEDAWKAIPPGNPAWVASRQAWFAHRLDALEAMAEPTDRETTAATQAIERLLDRFQADAPDTTGRVEAGLARSRFELSDRVDRPADAADTLDRLETLPLRPGQRVRLQGRRILLELRQGRYPEAERRLPALLGTEDRGAWSEVARDLGRMALRGQTDLQQRRTGSILRAILTRLRHPGAMDLELDLLEARATLARGDIAAALPKLRELDRRRDRLDDATLRELAETWSAAGDPQVAQGAIAALIRRHRPGSRPWLECRYRLARLAVEAGQPRDARRIIEATTLLHPDLGGAELRHRFEQLERRLNDGSAR